MKLSVKCTLFATILSLASSSIIAVDSTKQGKQLRAGGRNVMVVTEKELGDAKKEKFMTEEDDELDADVLINDDDEDDDDVDELQAFMDFFDTQWKKSDIAQKKAVLVEEDDADSDDDLDEDELDLEDDDGDEDEELEELQAFIDFVNAKEGLNSQQKTGAIIVEEEEDDDDDDEEDDEDVYFEDENERRRALVGEEDNNGSGVPAKTRSLGYGGRRRCYWYHGYKRCYYHHNYHHNYHYKPSY